MWKELDYVELNSAVIRMTHLDFPDLYLVQSDIFSIFPSSGSIAGIRSLLDNFSLRLPAYCEFKSSITYEFAVVSRAVNLFENLECNNA